MNYMQKATGPELNSSWWKVLTYHCLPGVKYVKSSQWLHIRICISGISLDMHPANGRHRYIVMTDVSHWLREHLDWSLVYDNGKIYTEHAEIKRLSQQQFCHHWQHQRLSKSNTMVVVTTTDIKIFAMKTVSLIYNVLILTMKSIILSQEHNIMLQWNSTPLNPKIIYPWQVFLHAIYHHDPVNITMKTMSMAHNSTIVSCSCWT